MNGIWNICNINGVGYDIGYAFDVITSRGAENYDCLLSGVLLSKLTVCSWAKSIEQGLLFSLNSDVDYACRNAMA